jgi:Domain of unknown function (DUF4331)
MSSHREAPEISKDPVADNTDVYAWVTPGKTVTIIANFIPLQKPDGGPNFYEFGEDVLYKIKISNANLPQTDITYEFNFKTTVRNPNTFLYNTGPITSLSDPDWNRPQTYTVKRVTRSGGSSKTADDMDDADATKTSQGGYIVQQLGKGLACPPVNIGPRSTPDYAKLAASAVHSLGGGRLVFAGQRADAFFVDLGSIFDLGTLRPFQNLHLIPSAAAVGQNGVQALNVHTIALQVPISDLTKGGVVPTDVNDARAVIGIYASASRQRTSVLTSDGKHQSFGRYLAVSRLGNPLFNEVIVPMAKKDLWNRVNPFADKTFEKYVFQPELAKLLPVLYPGVFPNLAAYKKDRADLHAILLTGIPQGVVPGFQNFTGGYVADLLRLNVAIPPASSPNPLGLVGGDAAGFPNGRRLTDDVVTIELRAVAGATIPLVDKSFTPDGAAALVADGTALDPKTVMSTFPYIGTPFGGYQATPGTGSAA